ARHLLDQLEVPARAEGAVRAADDHRADLPLPADRRPDRRELAVHSGADGVQPPRRAQRDPKHAVRGPIELEGRELLLQRRTRGHGARCYEIATAPCRRHYQAVWPPSTASVWPVT